MRLSIAVFALCAAALAARSVFAAQDGTGTLRVKVDVDQDGDGEYVGASCLMSVYPFIESRTLTPDVVPLARERTDALGYAIFALPAGQYSVRAQCEHEGKAAYPGGPICCAYSNSTPKQHLVRDTDGGPLFLVQDVEITAGEETVASVGDALFERVDKNRIRMWVLIMLGVLIGGAVLVSIPKIRPRYDPKSDPRHPKRLEPSDPDHNPADFDRAFGDFLKKK